MGVFDRTGDWKPLMQAMEKHTTQNSMRIPAQLATSGNHVADLRACFLVGVRIDV